MIQKNIANTNTILEVEENLSSTLEFEKNGCSSHERDPFYE